MPYCFDCASASILRSGRNEGALWCFVRSHTRAPDWVCQSWSESVGGKTTVIERDRFFDLPHHLQVKNGVESQYETGC